MASDLHELRQAHETANMVLNAEMKLRLTHAHRKPQTDPEIALGTFC